MRYDASRPSGEQLGRPETVLEGIPTGVYHNGGRITFGPDGMGVRPGHLGRAEADPARPRLRLAGGRGRKRPGGPHRPGGPVAPRGRPADASPSGIAYTEGAIWMASLRGERLWRVPL